MEALKPRRIHPLWPTGAVLVGLVALFVKERHLGGRGHVETAFAIITGLAFGAALIARLKDLLGAEAAKKPTLTKLFGTTLAVTLGALLYALIPLVFDGDRSVDIRMRSVLWGVWPVAMLLGLLPMIAVEISVFGVATIKRYEEDRIARSFSRALGLGLLGSCLVYLNFLTAQHELRWTLSEANLIAPRAQTRRAVRELTKDVEVVLFFGRASEVADTAERFFEPLTALSPKLKVTRIDHALAGELARKAGVTENGYIGILHNKNKDKIRLGTDARNARSHFRRLNENFLKILIAITTDDQVAYFTTGHDERTDKPDKEDQRNTVKLIKQQLKAWQYKVKNLGIAEGLLEDVPKDASVVFVLGPEKPFLDAEAQAMVRAVSRGVRLMIALESEREGERLENLLGPLGLGFDPVVLANNRSLLPLTRTKADRTTIWSNRYSSHESVTTMTRNQRIPTLFSRTGALAKKPESALARSKTQLVLTAMEDTYQDANGNLEFDAQTERKKNFGLAAAVTVTATTAKKSDEGRVFVLADADVLSDRMLDMSRGNLFLFRDIVYWLRQTTDPIVPTISEADVRIVHRRDKDALLFYGMTFGIPILVFALGFWVAGRRRRR